MPQNNTENQSNTKYTKFNETVFDKEDINEQITWKIFISLIIIMLGIYIVKKHNK